MQSLSSIYPIQEHQKGNLTEAQYQEMYQQSLSDPEQFWSNWANNLLQWYKPWHTVKEVDFLRGHIRWFEGGQLNVSVNCIDRHLVDKAEQTAILWQGDEPDQVEHISYQQLHDEVCRMANLLRSRGVKKGDRVCIYMPMIPEVGYAMLACARIGAVHSVVFGGFSPESLRTRILDADCRVVITANEGMRGGKVIPLKANVDQALKDCPAVHTALVIKRTDNTIPFNSDRDLWYHEAKQEMSSSCAPEIMDAEDPLFILYTSGSTGKPKGVLHTTGGYLLYAAMTHRFVFGYKPGDLYWCTADAGWITGHSYIFYGPLANGATTLVFEGIPTYPDASRFWEIVEQHQVSIFYTAPTAIRALMRLGEAPVKKHDLSSLRLLGTVGEPINPEAWYWYYQVVGDSRCQIIDTWWQTETGAALITPIAGATPLKPGSATLPFFGIQPVLLDNEGNELVGASEGALAIKDSWPGQMRTVFGDHQRFIDTYFSAFPGYYNTGDGAKRDGDGYFWITGRMDDVLNVSGHRLGTAEIESALVLHSKVAEAAAVGYPHDIKGEGIYVYVTLMIGEEPSNQLADELIKFVAKQLGSFAKPDLIQWSISLPKTRSGKIMRRILRKIAHNDIDALGDISTLADPQVVDELIAQRHFK